jgi:hypothetical protein
MPKEDTQFKPGQSGNPGGRPRVDEETKRIRQLTKEQFKDLANILLSGTFEDLQRIQDAPETTALTGWTVKVIITAWERGDYKTLDELLNRLIGKVKDEHHFTGFVPFIAKSHDGKEAIEMSARELEE